MKVVEAWTTAFRAAEEGAAEAIKKLDGLLGSNGKLKVEHVLGYCSAGLPRALLVEGVRQALAARRQAEPEPEPEPSPPTSPQGVKVVSKGSEAFAAWGYKDSRFVLNGRTVKLESPHYELGGRELTKLIPFLEKEMATKIDLSVKPYPVPRSLSVLHSRLPSAVIAKLGES